MTSFRLYNTSSSFEVWRRQRRQKRRWRHRDNGCCSAMNCNLFFCSIRFVATSIWQITNSKDAKKKWKRAYRNAMPTPVNEYFLAHFCQLSDVKVQRRRVNERQTVKRKCHFFQFRVRSFFGAFFRFIILFQYFWISSSEFILIWIIMTLCAFPFLFFFCRLLFTVQFFSPFRFRFLCAVVLHGRLVISRTLGIGTPGVRVESLAQNKAIIYNFSEIVVIFGHRRPNSFTETLRRQ